MTNTQKSKVRELFTGDVVRFKGKVRTVATTTHAEFGRGMRIDWTDGSFDVTDYGRRVTVLASDFGGMATPFDARG